MTKQFWALIVIIVLVLVGVFAFTGNNSKGSKASNTQPSQHISGQGKAGVTLVEYGDYECPVCENYYATVKQVAQTYGEQIHFQFRNFPLQSVHPNAFAAARAAEAAALQNKFWEMHDALYEPADWSQWSTASNPNPYFEQYAKQLGLNVTQFKSDFASDKVNAIVNADLKEANRLSLAGTPTFFLDGKQIDNSAFADANGPSLAKFQAVLNAEITKKGGTPPASSTTDTSAATTTAQ